MVGAGCPNHAPANHADARARPASDWNHVARSYTLRLSVFGAVRWSRDRRPSEGNKPRPRVEVEQPGVPRPGNHSPSVGARSASR